MSSIRSKFIDEYFEARPQLKKPESGMLGYEIPRSWHYIVSKLLSEREILTTENTNLRESCTDLEARSARLFAESSDRKIWLRDILMNAGLAADPDKDSYTVSGKLLRLIARQYETAYGEPHNALWLDTADSRPIASQHRDRVNVMRGPDSPGYKESLERLRSDASKPFVPDTTQTGLKL